MINKIEEAVLKLLKMREKMKIKSIGWLIIVLLYCSNSYAENALSVDIGTMGPGINYTHSLSDKFNVRIGTHSLVYNLEPDEIKVNGIEYDNLDTSLFSAGILLDWHPFNGGFRLSSGAVYYKHELDFKSKTGESVTVGSTKYSYSEAGRISRSEKNNGVAPYLGIGYGNAVGKNKRWGFICDLGLVLMNEPDVAMVSNGGSLSSDPIFLRNLDVEKNENNKDFVPYPVVSAGIFYHF